MMKAEDIFHWHIHICSRLCTRHYYSFIHRSRFENFVSVMSAWTDVQYYSSSFLYSPADRWKTHFSFADPARWKIHVSFAGPPRGRADL